MTDIRVKFREYAPESLGVKVLPIFVINNVVTLLVRCSESVAMIYKRYLTGTLLPCIFVLAVIIIGSYRSVTVRRQMDRHLGDR